MMYIGREVEAERFMFPEGGGRRGKMREGNGYWKLVKELMFDLERRRHLVGMRGVIKAHLKLDVANHDDNKLGKAMNEGNLRR